MAGAQALTISRAGDSAAALLAPVEAVAVDGASLREMTQGCRVFTLAQDGQQVGAVAARIVSTDAGRALEVTAAAASTAGGGVGAIVEWAEGLAQQQQANRLTCTTARPGLVRKLKARGFKVAGYIMTKAV